MNYSAQEVIEYARQADVKFIRLAFCDAYGRQKNIAVMPSELSRAFDTGIAFDASAVPGFGGAVRSDLFLHPDPATLTGLPWRPETGRVVRMFCDISHPDGSPFEADSRGILRRAVKAAAGYGLRFYFGPEMEFYLFKNGPDGERTDSPCDNAGYMDIAPDDKGENVRREVCLMLEQMGIQPEGSHHEEGPGQNEIDFRYSDPLSAADNSLSFRAVVKTVAAGYGLTADFSPKPLADHPGSGMHINFSVRSGDGVDHMPQVIAGIMDKIADMTLFMNPCRNSYARLGGAKAPGYITWSSENRSQLIRIPAAFGEFRRAELRSPDPAANPYIAFVLLIYAGLYGVKNGLSLPESTDVNLYTASEDVLDGLKKLPASLYEAQRAARASSFIAGCLPEELTDIYCSIG